MSVQDEISGGTLVAEVLAKQGVQFLYTLIGGHISPIIVSADKLGIKVVDVRDEVTAVFAADATARLTGVTGVAAVTAGPGLTNTITAVKNAQMAQSPVVLIGGSAATLLKGRGALQDIDQLELMKPLVKWAVSISKVRDIVPTLEKAFRQAQEGVPGPVFVELPIDLLYPESIVRDWTMASAGKGLIGKALGLYLKNHLRKLFSKAWETRATEPSPLVADVPASGEVEKIVSYLKKAERPVLVIGSQALLDANLVGELQKAVLKLGIPTFLSGMARGLLGHSELHMRHKRSKALREADVVLIVGVPIDFRLGYGQGINRKAVHIGINRSKEDLTKNKKPTLGVQADPNTTLQIVAAHWSGPDNKEAWQDWFTKLKTRNDGRDAEIQQQAAEPTEYVNPVWLCQQLEKHIAEDSILIGDGGDFVATASYIIRPRSPLSWLDPGAFGTLGPGGGFAMASKLCRPSAEIWLLYGDGSAGYSLAEFDTYARHGLPIIAVIGNDASWAQIAREQVEILGSPLGTVLSRTNYHIVAEGYGGVGICVDKPEEVEPALLRAKELAAEGRPVCLNIMIGKTDFRKGSISV